MNRTIRHTLVAILDALLLTPLAAPAQSPQSGSGPLRIISRVITPERPPLHGANYTEPKGLRLATTWRVSDDNGQSWTTFSPKPDFTAGLPYGYRREATTSVVDPKTGRLLLLINALDTPGLNPGKIEPLIALKEYYLRYRVSEDGGRTWLFDEPIVHSGKFTEQHPFEGVYRGKNGFFSGDVGSIPIITRNGRILVAAEATMLDKDGQLWNPTGQTTFSDVFIIMGTWKDKGRIEWKASHRVQGDPARSTRGMIEPTLAQFGDGRILMVMRGSNAGKATLPSYRWFSISNDDGETWTKPRPWTYEDGEAFFSPSSMSVLIKHSNGRVFWVANVSGTNCSGNDPRWPVIVGEVDRKTLMLIRSSVVEIDTKRPEDAVRGRELVAKFSGKVDLSHFRVIEDRETHELVITYPRAFGGYVKMDWATVRIAIASQRR
jgi:Neuraminidase (sialidase)